VIAMPSGCYGSSCFGCYGGGVVAAAPLGVPAVGIPTGSPKVTMPPAGDATVIPQSEAERDAIRNLLDKLRKGKQPPDEAAKSTAPKAAATAHLTVNLPAEARLWVDQVECPLTSAVRAFDTPPLQPGQVYYYTLRVQVNRPGGPVTDSQRVLVSAGQNVSVNFTNVGTVSTAQR